MGSGTLLLLFGLCFAQTVAPYCNVAMGGMDAIGPGVEKMMQIKGAARSDIPALVDIWHSGWHQAHAAVVPTALVASRTKAEFEARTRTHLGQTHVMWADQAIAGFYMLLVDELYQFYVAPDYQGRGVARDLLSAAEAALGPGPKWLACSVGNTHAAGFYEACGWARVATIPYEVEASEGAQVVHVWRYEKDLPKE